VLRNRLICHALLVMRPAISGVEPILLLALREAGVDARVSSPRLHITRLALTDTPEPV
jgi:hypothetical protein